MKNLIAAIILLVPFIGHSQEATMESSRFSVGVNFSPNYDYRSLNYSGSFEPLVEAREKYECSAFGFNTGIAARYLIVDKLEVELGVQFSRQTSLLKDVPMTDASGNVSGKARSEMRFHYLEIPLRLNYRVIDKQFFGYVTAGVSLNQFLNDKSKSWVTYNDGDKKVIDDESSLTDINETGFSMLGGIGIGYHINSKFDARVEPLFRYSLTALADAPIEQYNYSIGCQVGLNWKF